MPLVGESAGSRWAYTFDDDLYSVSSDLDFPPTPTFFKVFLAKYFEFDDEGAVDTGIINIRRRLPDNSDETITFPDLDALDSRSVKFDSNMTHVSYGMKVSNCYAKLVWTLGRW